MRHGRSLLTQDIQHTTRFAYYRCRYGHGRLTPFFQFLREKNFIRPLEPRELARLAENVKTIRCSSCGAPVDLAKTTTCGYCSSPLMVLDPDAVGRTLGELDAAERRRTAPDPDRRGEAIIALAQLERDMARARAAEGADFDRRPRRPRPHRAGPLARAGRDGKVPAVDC